MSHSRATPYSIRSTAVMLDNPERRYVLTINDLPADEKPRERLLAEGPAALSTAELLAVLLTTGTTKEDVLSMSTRIMRDYGEKGVLSATDPAQLAADLDIPVGKAAQIVATGELGRRFYHRTGTSQHIIRTAADVYEYARSMATLPKEHLRGLYLNSHYRVIHDETISIGTVDTNLTHPREVFKPALEYGAAAVVLVHNHPSGIAEASPADIAVTKQLIDAGRLLGIELIDHVVITATGFASVPAPYTHL